MSDFKPTFDQAYAYYSKRMSHVRLAKTNSVSAQCPFHADKSPSLSINFAKGAWKCHTCNEGGGIFDFEKKMFPSQDVETCWKQIYRICGMDMPVRENANKQLVATYDYTDVMGGVLYQKLRYALPDGKKTFSQRRPDGNGRFIYNLEGVKKVLYRLPDLVTAQYVFIVEGEKDADNLTAALQPYLEKNPKIRIAVTTSFAGAGGKDTASKWLPDYSPYLAGKQTVIIPDNDATGKAFGQAVAASIKPYSAKTKVVELPGLPDKGDVSDWLEAGHVVEEIFKLAIATKEWRPEEVEHKLLIELNDFLDIAPPEMDWLVQGMIPANTNGMLLAHPKAGKSALSFDLALALASGSSFLGFDIPCRRRVALISREDSPDESSRRLKMLRAGDQRRNDVQWGQVWLNTRYQSHQFLLDNKADVDQLILELLKEQTDIAIFDVYRRLHLQEENDNTAMSLVTEALVRIQNEAKCSVLMVHHTKKEELDNIFRGQRGAGVSHGWTEFGLGISVEDESAPRREWVRKVEFELKYACPPDPVYFTIDGQENTDLRLNVVAAPEETQAAKPKQRRLSMLTSEPPVKSFYDRED